MRAWGFGAILLACASAQDAAAQVAEIPEAHLLLLDRSALRPADPARDGPRFEAAAKIITHDLMARHGANLILDSSAAPAHWSGLDVTGEAAAALHAAIPEWSPPPQAATGAAPPAAATPVRMLCVDVAALDSSDAKFQESLEQVAAGEGATLVVDHKAVVIGAPLFDITSRVRYTLETYRNTGKLPIVVGGPDVSLARVAILDRPTLLRSSSVGQGITAQLRAIATRIENELRPEAEAFKSEGARLKEQIPSLAPAEKQKTLQDYAEHQKAFTARIQERQDAIKAAVAVAQKKVEMSVGPIVLQILNDDHANFLLDRTAVVAGDDTLDITPAVIAKLNAALPHVDVVLAPAEKK